jgi:putative ABC transport system substrate-binding protein
MRTLLLCIALVISALPAWAADVLIIQGSRSAPFMEAVKGFNERYNGSSHTIVLADYAEVDVVRLAKEERPRLVLAVGDAALTACKKIRQTPVISLMALGSLQKESNGYLGGVAVTAAPERYIKLFRGMKGNRIGVLYNPAKTGWYLKRALKAAQSMGVTLQTIEVHNPGDTVAALQQLKGKIDVLWMIPDATTASAGGAESQAQFAMDNNLPLVAFAAAYLDKGAVAALDIDRAEMGRQAGELVYTVLNGSSDAAIIDPRATKLRINDAVAKRLGLALAGLE